jgi:hypothetical protein
MSQPDSQSTTDEVIEPTQTYREVTEARRMRQEERLAAWEHDAQPGYSQYSEESAVPCSLKEYTGSQAFSPTHKSEILIPDTPAPTHMRAGTKVFTKKQIEEVTAFLEGKGYTVFTHKHGMQMMHLAFCMYEEDKLEIETD